MFVAVVLERESEQEQGVIISCAHNSLQDLR